MTPEQGRRVEELYDRLSDADRAQWPRLLDELCPDDAVVRAEVESLLKQSGATLAPEAAATAASSHDIKQAFESIGAAVADPLIGTDVGPYHIIEKLGEGGMGAVYKARQTKPVRRDVAIKLVRQGMASDEVLARFEAERQALAIMDHPNIARVLDAGVDEQRRPYFVMDFVPGEPVTGYCDRHNLTTRTRLELFAQICDAVQHAHTKGIIHRDIKPSNVLVAVKEDKPVPTVIDFGVAKALSQRLTEREYFTEYGRIIGTPEYMSPEQAEMNQLDVDARSDIYSLGVLLYELLSGALPFDSRTLRSAAYGEIQRIIREVDPPRPSTRLSSLDVTDATKIAQRRRETLPALASELRQELEWIPLKAIRKDRTERYRTAMELADDVRNYLAGKPLIAGPEAVRYKVKKFVRRNRGRVIASVSAAAVILVTAIVAFVMITRARNIAVAAQIEEQRQRLRAEQNFALASDAVQQFFIKVSREQLLDQAGLSRLRGGLLGSAVEYYQKFVEQRKDDPALRAEVAQALNQLGDFATVTGDPIGAMKALAESLRIRRQIASEHPEQPGLQQDIAATLGNLGRAKHHGNDLPGAQQDYTEAAALLEKLAGAAAQNASLQLDLAQALHNLATLLSDAGSPAEAEPKYRRALEIRQRVASSASPVRLRAQADVATSCNDLALFLEDQKKLPEAIEFYRRAVRAREAIATTDPDSTQAILDTAHSMGLLGEAQVNSGNAEVGKNTLQQASLKWQEVMGDPKHRGIYPMQAQAFYTIAWFEMLVGDPKRALEPANKALDAYPGLPQAKLNQAHALLFAGRFNDAKDVYQQNARLDMGAGASLAQRALEDFATLRKFGREAEGMRDIQAMLIPLVGRAP